MTLSVSIATNRPSSQRCILDRVYEDPLTFPIFHLVIGGMAEANVRQELALGHGCRLAIYRDDDIADTEAGLVGPRGALGHHILDHEGYAVGNQAVRAQRRGTGPTHLAMLNSAVNNLG